MLRSITIWILTLTKRKNGRKKIESMAVWRSAVWPYEDRRYGRMKIDIIDNIIKVRLEIRRSDPNHFFARDGPSHAYYHVSIIWFNCFWPVLTCFFYNCFHFSSLPKLLCWISIQMSMFLFDVSFADANYSCLFFRCSIWLMMLIYDHYSNIFMLTIIYPMLMFLLPAFADICYWWNCFFFLTIVYEVGHISWKFYSKWFIYLSMTMKLLKTLPIG